MEFHKDIIVNSTLCNHDYICWWIFIIQTDQAAFIPTGNSGYTKEHFPINHLQYIKSPNHIYMNTKFVFTQWLCVHILQLYVYLSLAGDNKITPLCSHVSCSFKLHKRFPAPSHIVTHVVKTFANICLAQCQLIL